MVSQINLSDEKISVNNENLDWIALANLVVLILSLMILLFLHYASQSVKDIDLAIMIISLSVMLITLPIHGRENRIARLLSFFKKFSHSKFDVLETRYRLRKGKGHFTVTDLAKFLGMSGSWPFPRAI
jgi:hypothetical protein